MLLLFFYPQARLLSLSKSARWNMSFLNQLNIKVSVARRSGCLAITTGKKIKNKPKMNIWGWFFFFFFSQKKSCGYGSLTSSHFQFENNQFEKIKVWNYLESCVTLKVCLLSDNVMSQLKQPKTEKVSAVFKSEQLFAFLLSFQSPC